MTPQDALREAFHYAVENGSVGLKQTDAMLAGVRRMDELEAALRECQQTARDVLVSSAIACIAVGRIADRVLGEAS